jgi:hypothetical protein
MAHNGTVEELYRPPINWNKVVKISAPVVAGAAFLAWLIPKYIKSDISETQTEALIKEPTPITDTRPIIGSLASSSREKDAKESLLKEMVISSKVVKILDIGKDSKGVYDIDSIVNTKGLDDYYIIDVTHKDRGEDRSVYDRVLVGLKNGKWRTYKAKEIGILKDDGTFISQ